MVTPQSQNVKSCLKNGLVSSHETVGRWFVFVCFVVRIFWRN